MEEIKSLQVMALGDRDMPLTPQVRLQGTFAKDLTAAVEEGQRRHPSLRVDDVVRVALRLGMVQIGRILEAQGRIEHGGHVSFPPSGQSGKTGSRLDALRGTVIAQAGLVESEVLIRTTASMVLPQAQGPKDTVSTAHDHSKA